MQGSAGLPGYQPPAQPPLPFISSPLTASLFHYFIISTAPRFPPCPVSHLDSCIVRFALFSGCRFHRTTGWPLFPEHDDPSAWSFGSCRRSRRNHKAAQTYTLSHRRHSFKSSPTFPSRARMSPVRLLRLPNPSFTLHALQPYSALQIIQWRAQSRQ
jgi:hypothetical protein